ncbi:MAG: type 1 glutamine amidotransferase [Candidatus Thalassarchaeaceae archaeon]|jgi:GMP synthase-like glutamine amidotransferase|nr:type 1 glutamine amidotransferase [Candidatus Thalassarchaeaceae archaeon]MDP6703467.1 type 1 glutamine amidotransferase [Candidatus Thalassarchaeaceae archaeon]MDP7004366.1 type 1 glutamine amidotransferase [Candidatus Thalassarchaeaceae archaeon]
MGAGTRVLLIDLLVERSEFGHGGNQEIVRPIADSGSVEVLLVTPQMQSEEAGRRAQEAGEVAITEEDVPHWDDDFGFWAECVVEMGGNRVTFRRIAMPLHGEDSPTAEWLGSIAPDAVICSGSRRNVSIWEDWMDCGAALLRSAISIGIPTLGICFGHQLLCKALGATVERADSLSNGVWDLDLTEEGDSDELFASRRSGGEGSPVVLFTHRDHVMSVPECCTLLGSTEHNGVTAVRVNSEDGVSLPAWGVQFHPEAAKARIERAFEWGHITREELVSFQREHDGAGILESFAAVITGH